MMAGNAGLANPIDPGMTDQTHGEEFQRLKATRARGVEYDGIGMEVPPPNKEFGLQLIEGLAQQVQGRIEYVSMQQVREQFFVFRSGSRLPCFDDSSVEAASPTEVLMPQCGRPATS
jgi:hypothetical protein